MPEDVRSLVQHYMPDFPLKRCGKIYTDTTQFMDINHGDLISLGGLHYMVLKDEAERRFGIEDPKYWVKRCRVLENGERKILKLVFHERFPMQVGPFTIECFRSPRKEARILELVKSDHRFMQGITVKDDKDNPVRVLDIIQGKRLDMAIHALKMDHETYFHERFPEILKKYVDSCRAIGHLHINGEKHGDVRRDHLWVEYGTNDYRWIDFDYSFNFHENPFGLDIFGLGNILVFLTGKTNITSTYARENFDQDILNTITDNDYSIIIGNRIVNLKKLFPYIPEELNRVLLHFSVGARVFYDSVDELLEELAPCIDLCRG